MLDAIVRGSAEFRSSGGAVSQAAGSSLEGEVGEKATGWASSRLQVPPDLTIRAPFSATASSFSWERGGAGLLQGRLPPSRRSGVVGIPAGDPGSVDDRLPCPPGHEICRQPGAPPRSEGSAPEVQRRPLSFDGGEIRRDPRPPLPAHQGGPEPFGGSREPGSLRGHRIAGRRGDPDPLVAARPLADPERVPFGGGEEDPGGFLRPRLAGDPVPVERRRGASPAKAWRPTWMWKPATSRWTGCCRSPRDPQRRPWIPAARRLRTPGTASRNCPSGAYSGSARIRSATGVGP